MKDFLKKLIAKKEQEVKTIRSNIKASESAQEVRELGETLQAVLDELNEAKDKLAELDDKNTDDKNTDDPAKSDDGNDAGDENGQRSN